MPAYNIKVAVRRKEMYLEVDHGLTGSGYPHLFLRSSASSAPVPARSRAVAGRLVVERDRSLA